MYLRKKLKRVLALVLVFCLSASLVSVPAYAVEEDPGRTLICGETEHTHGPECYGEPVLVCGQEESDGHTHTDECYGEEVKELTCGKEETAGHTHTDECYTVSDTPTCGLEETEGHKHSADCRTLICGKSASTDVDDPNYHQHDDSCWEYSCGGVETEGHTHTEACYGKELTCGQEEAEAHTHTDECYTVTRPLICGQDEGGHTHSDACYERPLICEIPEHTHTEACYAAEPEAPEIDEATQAVIDMFNALPDKDDEGYDEAYNAAFAAYVALPVEQQALVREAIGEEVLLGEAENAATYSEGEYEISSTVNGPITITGTVTLTGNGTIRGNGGSAIIVKNGGHLTLKGNITITGGTGTKISKNSDGSWLVGGERYDNEYQETYNGVEDTWFPNGFADIMRKALTGAGGVALAGATAGGGILLVGNSSLTMYGGNITGNSAQMGGGICAFRSAKVYIYGGTISNNKATYYGGGGMFLCAPGNVMDPTVEGGSPISITGNRTETTCELGGGGIFLESVGTMTVKNAVITNNTANGLGGGVAACLHGTVANLTPDTAAIYGNNLTGDYYELSPEWGYAHNVIDHSMNPCINWTDGLRRNAVDYFVAGYSLVGSSSLGGAKANWSGVALYAPSSGSGAVDVSETKVSTAKNDPIIVKGLLGMTNNSDAVKTAAENFSGKKVTISGNYSNVHGGGIGTNGLLSFGQEEETYTYSESTISLNATKNVTGAPDFTAKDGYTFELWLTNKNGTSASTKLGTVKSDENGAITFQNIKTSTLFGGGHTAGDVNAMLELKEISDTSHPGVSFDSTVRVITITGKRDVSEEKTSVGKYTIHSYTVTDSITNVVINKGNVSCDGNAITLINQANFTNTQKYDLTLTLVKYVVVDGVKTTVPLKDATFNLYSGNPGAGRLVASNLTTDKDGRVSYTIDDVSYNNLSKYYFVETAAPAGYVLNDEPAKPGSITHNVSDGTASGTATAYNNGGTENGSFSLNIVKYDPVHGVMDEDKYTSKLDGAVFSLTYEGQYIKDYTTANGGKLTINDLAPGSYKLVETKAPTGFILPENNSIEFEVDTDGKVTVTNSTFTGNHQLLEGTNTLNIPNDQAHGNLSLTKKINRDTTGGTSLAGKKYTFSITGKDVYGDVVDFHKYALSFSLTQGTALEVSDDGRTAYVTVEENATGTFKNLPYGTYTITEDTTDIDVKYYFYNGVSYSVSGGVDVLVGDPNGETVEVVATNEYRIYKASLQIGKRIVANGAPMNEANDDFFAGHEFKFTLSLLRAADGVATWQDQTFILEPGQTETISGLPIGTYKLVEENYDDVKNYDFDYVAGSSSLVTQGGKGVMFIELTSQSNGNTVWFDACNNYNVKTGDIVIHKDASMDGTLYGEEGEHIVEQFHFFLDGTDLNGNEVHRDLWVNYSDEATFKDVPYGTYTITEDMKAAGVDNYEFGGVTFKNGDTTQRFDADGVGKEGWGFQVTLDDDNNSSNVELKLDVTNEYTRKLDSMSVQKIISGNSMDYSAKYDFTIAFKVPASYVKLAGAYPYDVYDAQGSVIRSSSIQKVQSEKTFEAAGGTPVTGGGVSVIGDKTVEVDGEYYTVYGTIEGLGNGEKAVVSKLPVGVKWHVVEVKENQGYSTNYDHQNGVVTENAENSVTVTNSSSVYTTVNVQKVWVGDNANRRPDSITVQLVRNGQPVEGQTKVLNEANGWHASWSGLSYGPRYTVIEVSGNSGYTTAVTGEGSGTTVNITVTNTYDERSDNTRLRVNKVWVGDDPFTRPNEVTVQLLRNGEPNGTVTLSESNNWTYEWTGLDASATYDVEELNIPAGYTVSKTQDGRTYTIYNTYDTTIPDEDIPLTDLPENDIPLADLPDDDIPLAEIPDDEIPLDEAPQTGDNSRKGLWLALAICSAFGMAITGKLLKTKEEDQGDGEN